MKALAPFSLLYAGASWLHRSLFLRPKLRDRHQLLPLIVIGALRAGGSGKTAVTLALARHLTGQGLRVGVLAYWLRKHDSHHGSLRRVHADLAEVLPESDWRHCSDEAVLLARKSGARVFVTRNRERAWGHLSQPGIEQDAFDVLLSDDGLMDARLRGAFRMVLHDGDQTPGLFDLLPAGPYRLTARALRSADWVAASESITRTLQIPEGLDRKAKDRDEKYQDVKYRDVKWWAVCGLGQPHKFVRDLAQLGIPLTGISLGRDHALPALGKLRRVVRNHSGIRFLGTAKDGIKMESLAPEWGGFTVVEERVELGSALLSAVSEYLRRSASS